MLLPNSADEDVNNRNRALSVLTACLQRKARDGGR